MIILHRRDTKPSSKLILPREVAAFFSAALAISLGGCAKTPSGIASSSNGQQLFISMTVQGVINPADYYFVVINNTNNSTGTSGPVPVVAAPWGGNGFVAGSATQYVEYHSGLPGDGYAVYAFNTSTAGVLSQGAELAPPINDTPITSGSQTIEFSIPVSELATSTVSSSQTNYIQINFINTDSLPTGNDVNAVHDFDALGNSAAGNFNSWITVPTTTNGTFTNSSFSNLVGPNEAASCTGNGGVVPYNGSDAPNLDITAFEVQVTG
jgi:hypothetical protein